MALPHPENFTVRYLAHVRAREERADLIADEIVTIADTQADANKARVRVDARKWWAAKVDPKKYGERITAEVNTNIPSSAPSQ